MITARTSTNHSAASSRRPASSVFRSALRSSSFDPNLVSIPLQNFENDDSDLISSPIDGMPPASLDNPDLTDVQERRHEHGLEDDDEDRKDTLVGSSGGVRDRPKLDRVGASTHRLQMAVKKVIEMRRKSDYSLLQEMGREPGIDPKRVDLTWLKQNVVVQAVDYIKDKADFFVLMNKDVPAFLEKPKPEGTQRWIHVNGGRSWDVIKPIALKYNLHPLSLEHILHHGNKSTRSKVDYYKQHLFVSITVHKPAAADSEDDLQSYFKSNPASAPKKEVKSSSSKMPAPPRKMGALSHEKYNLALVSAFMQYVLSPAKPKRTLSGNMPASILPKEKDPTLRKQDAERLLARKTVDDHTKKYEVNILLEQLSIFLLPSGTIISFTQDPGFHARFSKIFDRIHSRDDIIRKSEDSGFILQALLDVVADHALEIVDEFKEQIERLEARVLLRPTMSLVRHLHITSAQLILLRSNLDPFRHLLQSLRTREGGLISNEVKVYLGDVRDHIETVLCSLELFADLTENLISFTFNDLSYSTNSYARALSVLSVIFLPLTFLTGFFGMRFVIFPAALNNGNVTYFWKIGIPITVGSMILFSWYYILQLYFIARARLQKLRLGYMKHKTKV